MPNDIITLVFVHGWSVTGMDTYGELPQRLRAEGLINNLSLDVREIFLGRYISFHDEVRLHDISRAFRSAVDDQLSDLLSQGRRFVCITHSTGGPVIRDWWHTFWQGKTGCPMSHLIMLAPANFGSALAQLGKARVGRIMSWFQGVEPGQGVLDWLELGSREGWQVNTEWICQSDQVIGPGGIFPFVLTGQAIDRKLYDNLNTYTGEPGSDGVVRSAAANLNARFIRLTQPAITKDKNNVLVSGEFVPGEIMTAPATACRIVRKKAHSGETIGILRSVKKETTDLNSRDTIDAILRCIRVKTRPDYDSLCRAFVQETATVQKEELLETEKEMLFFDRYFIHDRYSMVVFRVRDNENHPVADYDLVLTAGDNNDPNHFPEGFCQDRQRNRLNPEVLTYFFNYDLLNGCDAVKSGSKVIRRKVDGIQKMGLQIIPRPDKGFVRYLPCRITASAEMFNRILVPNSTTLVDIVLQRLVDKEVFRLEKMNDDSVLKESFKGTKPGGEII